MHSQCEALQVHCRILGKRILTGVSTLFWDHLMALGGQRPVQKELWWSGCNGREKSRTGGSWRCWQPRAGSRCHCAVVTMSFPPSLSVTRQAPEHATLFGTDPSDSILGLSERPITSQALNYKHHPSIPEEGRQRKKSPLKQTFLHFYFCFDLHKISFDESPPQP